MKAEADSNLVHQLVLIHGKDRAREMVPEKQRSLIDIAAGVLQDEGQAIGISYTGFCLTSLPHKRLPDDQAWTKIGHKVTLMVEPGRMMVRKKDPALRCSIRRACADDPPFPPRAGNPYRQSGNRARTIAIRMDVPHGHRVGRRDSACDP